MNKAGFIGYGEAGRAFAAASGWKGETSTFDIKLADPAAGPVLQQACKADGTRAVDTLDALLAANQRLVSVVTADQALAVAAEAAASIRPGSLYFDLNSVAPQTKQQAARLIEAAGGVYLDVAVMAPVHPARLATPLLVSGARAPDGMQTLLDFGFSNVRVAGDAVGQASAIKMMRSIVIKGIEALTVQCLIAADKAGVSVEVVKALGPEWTDRIAYNLERVLVHGRRRAAELDEVAAMLAQLGVAPDLMVAAAEIHRTVGAPGPLPERLRRLHLAADSAADKPADRA